ncbi:MAG TPA: hypothetical protein VFX61_10560 [Micromonosporaceae bacterium]|nr:hypothetical protein [Micromonosporaceae bacterium]
MAPWDPPGRTELWDPASSTGPQHRPDSLRAAFPDGDERWADPEDAEFWASAVDPTPPSAPPPTGSGRNWLDDPIGDLAPALPSLGTPPPSAADPEGAPPPWSTPQTPATVPPTVANVPPPAYPQPPPTGWQRPPALAGRSADAFSQSADPPPGSPPSPPPGGPHPPMPPGGPVPPYPPNPPLPPPKHNNRLALILGLIALLLLCCCASVAGSMLIWGDDLYEQIRDRNRQSIVHWGVATD